MTKTILKIIRVLLAAAAVFVCADLFYGMVSARLDLAANSHLRPEILDRRIRADTPDSQMPRQQAYAYYGAIAQKDLFHTGQAKTPADARAGAELENLEKTRLNLRLWGTITGTDEKAYAVIEEKSGSKQALYQEGDTIDQARIRMILRKRVVLTVNGKDEILEMEDLADQASRLPDGQVQPAPEAADISVSEEPISISGQQMDEAMQDVSTLMRQVRIRPYFEDGRPGGLMLSGIRSESVFSEMGLESGDIIKSINGRQIRSVEDAMTFYENMQSSGEVELEIERNGSSQILSFQID
ncbi:general secretion pathway protein C [Desulfosalsimonas propionicica]|uniref:General secretion pathway protein C n=1 Tax=Desulfosalsimonas propionicica TaxID=332175 RepID=A0A7W0C7S0_9BACT|nr:type II secretion system protein GspC [Desulfosalsimonas propionicica]MBA2880687.1 general secretion pathway protein C [Desulfosalsimonas propionicica]